MVLRETPDNKQFISNLFLFKIGGFFLLLLFGFLSFTLLKPERCLNPAQEQLYKQQMVCCFFFFPLFSVATCNQILQRIFSWGKKKKKS